MERKRKTYLSHWRRFKGLSRRELLDKLQEYAAEHDEKGLPTTEASLSRIEAGDQNFKTNFIEAVAEILSDEAGQVTRGDLYDRNPFEGLSQVISLIDHLGPEQQRRAVDVLNAMFGSENGSK